MVPRPGATFRFEAVAAESRRDQRQCTSRVSGGDERVVPLNIASGAEVNHYFEMKAVEPAVVVGRVSIVTDPPGARVAVDGKARGTSPIIVTDLTPADHKVTVTSDTGSAERTI